MSLIFGVDFDGTCVAHAFPLVGMEIGAAPVLKWLTDNDHKLILWTIRSKHALEDAVSWFKKHDIPLYGINKNPQASSWTSSPKAYANIYIDDAALGCPLKVDPLISDRPFVDWVAVKLMLIEVLNGTLPIGYTAFIATEDDNGPT